MKFVIAGGSGHVGAALIRHFAPRGVEIVTLSRRTSNCGANGGVRTVFWDGRTVEAWAAEIDRADVLINLAGKSVNCRYGAANRREILASRVDSTRALGAAIHASRNPPPIWLQASTATIYSHRFDAPNDEDSGILGGSEAGAPDTWRFSIDVARAWEAAAAEVPTPRTRRVLLRSAMTMSPDRGSVFDAFYGLVRRGMGGSQGDGRQFVSWIHEQDFARAVQWLIEHDELSGPVNLAAPTPLTNADFMRALRDAAGVRIGLPAPRWMLEVGARLVGTETELLLKSRRVVPGRLLANGFSFRFPDWPSAARDLVQRWRAARKEDAP